jgi:hypothetical protein
MADVLVDVVAAAAQLEARQAAGGGSRDAPAATGTATCPLNHRQPAGQRFCSECGLPMAEVKLTPRVDLDAVRQATASYAALSGEEKARADREHAEAMAANLRAEQEVVPLEQQQDPSEAKLRIHFVSDGFTWAGRVWYTGEEIEIGPKHPRWESAQPWITMTKTQQYERYGRVMFDHGPFPGRQAPPGAEMYLPNAPTALWAEARGSFPARPSADNDGSLVPW